MHAQPAMLERDPFYYLRNFQAVVEWMAIRYHDFLPVPERNFLGLFPSLPKLSQALLVRMVMRTRVLFRRADLGYAEVPNLADAIDPLVACGWVAARPRLKVEDLGRASSKTQLIEIFPNAGLNTRMSKASMIAICAAMYPQAGSIDEWSGGRAEQVFLLRAAGTCERLRAIYFGNDRQTWSEFILADLGIVVYEKVECSPPFRSAAQIEHFWAVLAARRLLEEGAALDAVQRAIPNALDECEWLEARRQKLLFRLGRAHEREKDKPAALRIYSQCSHAGAAQRMLRIRLGRAYRTLFPPRPIRVPKFEVALAQPAAPYSVERMVGEFLSSREQPGNSVHYVENMLINSLFGLLCWRAVFAPVPGAFFHAFHRGPVDLSDAKFLQRRDREFAACFAELDGGAYKDTIRKCFADKCGTASPFVSWRGLSADLLDLALECLPAEHLKHWFQRIAEDVSTNRAGFPDLIQFWPGARRYRMVEVKAPGDRLHENQLRWMTFCLAKDMPVAVCNVRWLNAPRNP